MLAILVALTAIPLISGAETVEKTWTPELMMKVRRIGSVQVSPDGRRAAFTVREAIMTEDKSEYLTHIHVAHFDGQNTRQLTQGDKSCDDPQWSPDNRSLAFISARGGRKNIWIIGGDGGEAVQVTDVKSDVTSLRWSPDGMWLAFTAIDPPTADEERRLKMKDDVRRVDEALKLNRLFVIAATARPGQGEEPRLLTPDALSVFTEGVRPGRAAFDWSPDSQSIVFAHNRSPRPDDWPTADLSLVHCPTGTIKAVARSARAESNPFFSPDGKFIAFTASDDPPTWPGTKTVQIVPAAGGSSQSLAATQDAFGRYSEILGWKADGSALYFTEIQGTSLQIMTLPLKGSPQKLSQARGMALSGVFLNATRTHFGFAWETLDQPAEAYVTSVDKFQALAVSQVNRSVPQASFGRTEVVRWKSTDGLDIEGLVTVPAHHKPGSRAPLLVIPHGGPMGVYTETFDGNAATYPVAAFAERGYVVLRPNVRGSSGYGKKFRYANVGDWGGGDYQDLLAGVDHLIKQGVADAERLGIMGWSYGGYMTSWTITQTKRFRAASVGAGVTNLMSFNGTADIPGFLPDYFGGEFWDKPEVYQRHSAMFQIKGVTTPTLIQHGERDERVPLAQGLELHQALKRQGCPTKMSIYPRTPHGIEEPRLLLSAMHENLQWFDDYLLKNRQHSDPSSATKPN